ncbi:uncharacterized protein LOC102807532 [Saccoglossus kowalevskii]|uniref:Achaete-scute homolog 1a-like n=1 Tax=Saccoglossus kowalevskii TaxID=10224 RepID=A0ABM0MFG8_SACKO|nr:PREDICTED: achaete-scute homolog 1a-like [Saccoglossus kowalevskii]
MEQQAFGGSNIGPMTTANHNTVSGSSIVIATSNRARHRRVRSTVAAISRNPPRQQHREKEPHLVARRNARERRRVQMVNDGFIRLRRHVPTDPRNKKLSKVKTLRSAINYILHLQSLLKDSNYGNDQPEQHSPNINEHHGTNIEWLGFDMENNMDCNTGEESFEF